LGTRPKQQYVLTDSDGTITFETGSELMYQIIITEYDGINTVSGTFKFNAEKQ
jgi:hypothetical protein